MFRFSARNRIAFISSYPPRMCGIATFTSHLIKNMTLASNGSFEPVIIAMQSNGSAKYSEVADFVIRKDLRSDYIQAANFINSDNIDMVVLQHEFGLFGGDGGTYISSLLKRINAPIVSTLHTVLERPASELFQSLLEVCDLSGKIIIMNKHGIDMLENIYGASKNKVELIPHGILDVPFGKTEIYKRKLNLNGRKVMMTFGLLGPNKGIEVALNAMHEIIKESPNALYLIVGKTHPEIVKEEGYSYRNKLQNLVENLKIRDYVRFYDRFVTDQQLKEFLAAADIYITPYLHKEQLTSGPLAFAVGCGKAVVSTPYWAAQELLDRDRGILIPFSDSHRLAESVVRLTNDEVLLKKMQSNAYSYGRKMTWANVGQQYWQLAAELLSQTSGKQQLEVSKSCFAFNLSRTRLYQDDRSAVALK